MMSDMINDELTYQQNSILDLMKMHVNMLNDELEALEQKAQVNIGIGSLVVGLISAFNLNQIYSPTATAFLWMALGAFAIGFIASIAALAPRSFRNYPLEPTLEKAQRVLVDKQAVEDYYNWLLDSFAQVLESAREPRQFKERMVRVSTICGGLVVMCVILAKIFA